MRLYYKILLVFLVSGASCHSDNAQSVCATHLSDDYYPQNTEELLSLLKDLDSKAAGMYPGTMTQIRAMVVPHEKLSVSGEIAAGCWRLVKDQQHISRVIFLVAEQDVPFCGVVLPTCMQFKNLLGTLQVDKNCRAMLGRQSAYFTSSPYIDTKCAVKKAVQRGKNSTLKGSPVTHDPFNHGSALEMQLLFCSYYLPQAQIVPLMIGTLTQEDAHTIAMHLKECTDRNTLVVVSSTLVTQATVLTLESLIASLSGTGAGIESKYPLMVLLSLIHKKSWGTHYLMKHDASGSVGMVWGDSSKKK